MKSERPNSDWLRLRLCVPAQAEDAVINFLFELGSSGCQQRDDFIEAYFSTAHDIQELRACLQRYLRELSTLGLAASEPTIELERIADRDWNAEWKARFKPLYVSARLIVKPTWETFEAAPDQIVIEIDPQQAFGTGHHATTRMALLFLERYLEAGQRVLDVGTGSGILAIAAAKLGARQAAALDYDCAAAIAARENCRLNGADRQVLIFAGELQALQSHAPAFDVVVANIDKTVILAQLAGLAALTKTAGLVFVTGLLSDEEVEISESAARNHLSVVEKSVDEEWLGLALRKESR